MHANQDSSTTHLSFAIFNNITNTSSIKIEHLLKAIFYWNAVPGASEYEISLDCHRKNGEEISVVQQDKLETVDIKKTCGGRPCFVYPAAPPGTNTVKVRAKIGDEGWTDWSEPVKYLVDQSTIGMAPQIPHDEL